ncbi:2,5-diketo-D-gluconic acid reductase A [Xylaria bambusicola]|uniref:2,5-diketo-D-gluconic acid reductase A n=1 Tax=Xylaria bambusicola TaxID=326684 RepID=UPI002008C64F|nr:2,5-diketo-D-gluconic acid reductase A [Xylaria bambusicola]KAI0512812.1 2,5-diketo-D-gluconic acid reductase A [Xylaria bambusicola]
MASTYNLNSTFKLNSGYEIPRLGFGVYQTPPNATKDACLEAFKAGYRHIDSAAAYRNEAGVGQAIRESGIPRSEVYFTSKIPAGVVRGGYEATKEQIETSLKTAEVDYFDLMLLHAPYGGSAARKGAWKALVEAAEEGKLRSIGISNYGIHHLDELEQHMAELKSERGNGGVISVGQYEIHPWCARNDVVDWFAKRNIACEAYSPVVQGQRWGEKTLVKLAEKHSKTEAQVLLRWSLQKGLVPLPKSVTPSRIKENADLYNFELSKEEMAELETNEYSPVCWDPLTSPLDN